ncbi:MAG: carbohydrate deacetylase [bacterium]
MMNTKRYLIVNADDFGQSHGVNLGIIEAFERGIVTSASLMVRWPAAIEVAANARAHSKLSVGLHVDLSEWACENETWFPLYEVVPLDDHAAVAAEVARQLERFRELLGRNPTHLDSHQHAHCKEPVHSVLKKLSQELHVPLRHYSSRVRYSGEFYGQSAKGRPYPEGISVNGLLDILTNLPAGATELGCHPGWAEDLESMYRLERAGEVKTLCDAHLRSFIAEAGIELCSFHNLNHELEGKPILGKTIEPK